MKPPTSAEVLPGVVATQLGLIQPNVLVGLLSEWPSAAGRGWIEFAVESGRLPDDARGLIESVVEKHLLFSGGVADESLKVLAANLPPHVQAALRAVTAPADAHATIAPTSAGARADERRIDGPHATPLPAQRNPVQAPDGDAAGVTLAHEPGEIGGGDDTIGPSSIEGRDSSATMNYSSAPSTDHDTLPLPRLLDADADARRPAPAHSAPPRRYQFLREHAAGGIGQVSVAFDTELSREVALKEIKPKYADDPNARMRFLLEGEVTGRLEHPGVVPVYGMGRSPDGRPYYAMRFIRGVSLSDEIDAYHAQGDDKSGQQAVRFRKLIGRFIDVCNTIDFAHSRGVLHRDIKPDNIMLGSYGETLVVDWGLAKIDAASEEALTDASGEKPLTVRGTGSSTVTQVGHVVGTPSYMSPEQARGEIDALDASTDVYSLGATLFEILTGDRPFVGRTSREVLTKVRAGDFRPPRQQSPGVPPAIEAVCMKAMAARPGERYAAAGALAEDLERWLADEPVTAWREPWTARARRWMRKNRSWVAGGAAAVLVATAGLLIGVVLLSASKERERLARVEAEEGFRTARNAVDKYFITVSEDVLLQQPGMQKLRQNLLTESLSYFQQFLNEHGNDPSVRHELAITNFYAAKITEEVSSPNESLRFYEAAAELQGGLVDADPQNAERLLDLGDILNGHGRALTKANRLGDAVNAYDRATDIREQLVRRAPGVAEHQRKMANTYMNRGVVEQRRLAYAEARANYQKAQKIRHELLEGHPTNLRVRRDLGEGYFNLAVLDELTLANGDRQQNIAVFERHLQSAVEALSEVVADDPRDLRNRHNLAISYRKLGTLKGVQRDLQGALDMYRQSLGRIEPLALQSPDVAEFQSTHAGVLMNMVIPLASIDPPAALRSARAAARIQRRLVDRHARRSEYRRDYGVCLRALGVLRRVQRDLPGARADLDESRRQLAAAVELEPTKVEYQQALEQTAVVLEQVEAAIAAEAAKKPQPPPAAAEKTAEPEASGD